LIYTGFIKEILFHNEGFEVLASPDMLKALLRT
jgi:hypothetical protein